MRDYGKKITSSSLVSVIIDTFYRPKMLKNAVTHILEQTYTNIELIIVNNGATKETIEYIEEVIKTDSRIKVVNFEENQFSWDDPHKLIRICYNAGLENATGDLVFYQSDDDWVNFDFIEKMVNLFVNNEKCTSAIGRVVNCLYNGKVINMYDVKERATYINGFDLAMDYILKENKIVQPNPGHSFVFKREILLKYGGFQDTFETHQILGIVAFGETGFDKSALMYWGRSSEEQLNVQMNKLNFFWGKYFINNILDPKNSILKNWESNFKSKDVTLLENHLNFVILSSYYKVKFTNFFRLKITNHISDYDIEYLKNLNFNFLAFKFGFFEFFNRSFMYKLYSISTIIIKKLLKYVIK
jgi:glycosyltransferase involved in cell wall biosynthesis